MVTRASRDGQAATVGDQYVRPRMLRGDELKAGTDASICFEVLSAPFDADDWARRANTMTMQLRLKAAEANRTAIETTTYAEVAMRGLREEVVTRASADGGMIDDVSLLPVTDTPCHYAMREMAPELLDQLESLSIFKGPYDAKTALNARVAWEDFLDEVKRTGVRRRQ